MSLEREARRTVSFFEGVRGGPWAGTRSGGIRFTGGMESNVRKTLCIIYEFSSRPSARIVPQGSMLPRRGETKRCRGPVESTPGPLNAPERGRQRGWGIGNGSYCVLSTLIYVRGASATPRDVHGTPVAVRPLSFRSSSCSTCLRGAVSLA